MIISRIAKAQHDFLKKNFSYPDTLYVGARESRQLAEVTEKTQAPVTYGDMAVIQVKKDEYLEVALNA